MYQSFKKNSHPIFFCIHFDLVKSKSFLFPEDHGANVQ